MFTNKPGLRTLRTLKSCNTITRSSFFINNNVRPPILQRLALSFIRDISDSLKGNKGTAYIYKGLQGFLFLLF